MHQKPFAPGTFFTKHLLHQPPFPPDNLTPEMFYTKNFLHRTGLLHQASSAPDTFYTRHVFDTTHHLWHQTTFAPNPWSTYPLPILLYTTSSNTHFAANTCLNQTDLFHQVFTPNTYYTRHCLHQAAFLHQTSLTRSNFSTKNSFYFTPNTLYILHQTVLTPETLYTKKLLHQSRETPGSFYTKQLLHKKRLTPGSTWQLVHQQFLHQTPFTPETSKTKQHLHRSQENPKVESHFFSKN